MGEKRGHIDKGGLLVAGTEEDDFMKQQHTRVLFAKSRVLKQKCSHTCIGALDMDYISLSRSIL